VQFDVLSSRDIMERDMSEEHLLKSIARGDRCAFEALYRCYYSRLTRFLARRLPPSHSADEIIDDTFMAVWQHAGEFRYQSQVSTWIFGIAYRVALKSLRRRKRWFAASADESPEPFIDPHRELEVRDWLAEGLRRLPDNQRLSLLLTYRWGHSIEQVAAMAECPAGTVKARMSHARAKLRHLLTALQ
jgi:RNA polymerase sigma-70 factor, ECF subfamily